MNRWTRQAAGVAMLCFVVSVAGFGGALEGYSQLVHPVALLGARGIAHASAFNALGFVVPGLLAAIVAWHLRRSMPGSAPWAARIGAWLALLSATAFAAQGLLPLDPNDLEAPTSHAHATAWMLWWVALLPAACLLAIGVRKDQWSRTFALASVVLAILVVCLVMLPLDWLPPAIAQRILFVAWLLWVLLAACKAEG
jgi:hypothetical membrane protein